MAQKDQTFESDMTKCSIETTTKTHDIRSIIKNVSKLELKRLIGPVFNITSECLGSICFDKDEVDVYVYMRNKTAAEIKIERKLVLYDCNYKKLHEEMGEEVFTLEKDKCCQLMKKVVKNRHNFDTLANDTLIIDLCVNIKEIVMGEINDTDPQRKLREDFKMMLENPVNSDVSLQVGNERIPAHWSVLCSRSPYFKKMFDSNMKERIDSSIIIADLSFSTVRKLLEFLYTAHFDHKRDLQELFELYYAADKYEVMDMRTFCRSKLISNVRTENVCQILQLAHHHFDQDLKMDAINFIQLHSDEVFLSEGWKTFQANEPLAAELFSFFCVKKN